MRPKTEYNTKETTDIYVRLNTEYSGQAKRTKEEKQAVQRGREHMCSMMCSARAECRRGDGERRGEREKKTEKITAAKIQFSHRKWSSHSGLEKEILRSQRPRGGEMEQF